MARARFEHLLVKHEGPVARIVLARPERRNALSLAVIEELLQALALLPEECVVVVVQAEGPAFSAGHDLSEMLGREDDFYAEIFDACTRLMLAIRDLPQPVIARVHGVATAAGCQLVASCDLAVAADDAGFATPGVKIGLFCSTPMVPVLRLIGRRRALEMLLTGDPIDARTALDWGLVNRVVPAGELDEAVDELVTRILRSSPRVIALGKRAFYEQVDVDERAAYEVGVRAMRANASDPDAQEGMDAFLTKRAPRWGTS